MIFTSQYIAQYRTKEHITDTSSQYTCFLIHLFKKRKTGVSLKQYYISKHYEGEYHLICRDKKYLFVHYYNYETLQALSGSRP